jgi:predicted transposase/invertase (TIGR01784 family)
MENRNYKDSVFVDLFARDITAKENFVSLYNALHETNLDYKTTEVKPVMIEQVLYKKYYNDIAMLIDNKIVVLIEHQSTVNENMPFRILEYITRVYEKVVETKKKFGKKLVKIPLPEFYVFYNGKEDFPVEKTLKLSDAFILPESKYAPESTFPLEISVKVVNINVDKENPILKRCKILDQYSEFIELVRKSIDSGTEEPFATAISSALKDGYLSDYLARKATEVHNMLMTEYDYDTDVDVQREEAAEQKAIETAKNFLQMGISQEQIAKGTGLSLEMLQSLAREWGITPNIRDKFKDSFLTEYDYDTDIAVQREEAAEQKAIETAKKGLTMNLSYKQISELTGLPLETVQKLAECK